MNWIQNFKVRVSSWGICCLDNTHTQTCTHTHTHTPLHAKEKSPSADQFNGYAATLKAMHGDFSRWWEDSGSCNARSSISFCTRLSTVSPVMYNLNPCACSVMHCWHSTSYQCHYWEDNTHLSKRSLTQEMLLLSGTTTEQKSSSWNSTSEDTDPRSLLTTGSLCCVQKQTGIQDGCVNESSWYSVWLSSTVYQSIKPF